MPILDEHNVARLALMPKCLLPQGNVFDPEQIFQLVRMDGEVGKQSSSWGLSIASEVIARPETGGVHGYGERTATRQNDSFRIRKGYDPDPVVVYVGFLAFKGHAVNSFVSSNHRVEVRWFPEHGEICHFQIEISPFPNVTKGERKLERAALSKHLTERVSRFEKLGGDVSEGERENLRQFTDSYESYLEGTAKGLL
jgi:hypothetical protein